MTPFLEIQCKIHVGIQDGPLRYLEEIWLGLHRPAVVNPAVCF